MMRIHLDTDFGGDPDDACALAMLLGWPDVEIVGITTTIDPGGRTAGYVAHFLELAGRSDIPVVAGAEVSLSNPTPANPIIGDERVWPEISPQPSKPGEALELLSRSIKQRATVVGIGPLTNLALLEKERPGSLAQVPVTVMGGWTQPPDPGFPAWGPEMDWNIQWDSEAAEVVGVAVTDLTLSTLHATMKAHLRVADLPRLRASGPLGELLARQSQVHAELEDMAEKAKENPALPDDLLNFHWDPVTCAVALGWEGVKIEEIGLRPVVTDRVLRFQPDEDGQLMRVVTDVDSEAFREVWLLAVEMAQRKRA